MPPTKHEIDSPDTTSLAYRAMEGRWSKIRTVLAGTDTMRAAGESLLPRHDNETDRSYKNRLKRAVLFNATELTLGELVGRPFSDPVKIEDAPESIKKLLDDVDLQGNDAHTFLRGVFREGLSKAFTHVLVDFPRVPESDNRTLDDDRKENLRPYWVHVKPECLLFASAEFHGGREILTHIRILESVKEKIGFAEEEKPQIRVMDLVEEGVQVSIYRPTKRKVGGKTQWEMVEAFLMDGIDFIPLVTFYADRCDFMEGKPPMLDVVELNIQHWQSCSDQEHCLTAARFPILAASGVPAPANVRTKDAIADTIVIGPYTILRSKDPAAKFYYVEHTGKALEAGEHAIEHIEVRMAEHGALFLKKKPGNPTATARALDSAEATSPLQDMTQRFISFTEMLLWVTAQWLEEEKTGTVVMTTDFGPEEFTQQDMSALTEARKNRDLSRTRFLLELKRRAVLADDFDEKKNESELENEMASVPEIDLDPTQKDDEEEE